MTPPDAVWPKSIECQGMHKNQGDFYFWNGATLSGGTELKDKKSGKIRGYRLGKQADAEKPAGEWNTFTTVCDGNTVTIFVNGKEVNKATGTNLSEGFIGLQVEGGATVDAELVLQDAGGGREHHVGRGRAHNDQVDVAR